jgi:hypothetical protein
MIDWRQNRKIRLGLDLTKTKQEPVTKQLARVKNSGGKIDSGQ